MIHLILTLLSTSIWATVHVEQGIVINAPIEKVCSFVGDPLNDHLWRREVHQITVEGRSGQLGSVYTEDAFIGIKPHFITKTKLTTYSCPYEVTFVTVEDNPYYLRSHRTFEVNDTVGTLFKYDVDFEEAMILETFGFPANPQVVADLYSIRMYGYLLRLKKILSKNK